MISTTYLMQTVSVVLVILLGPVMVYSINQDLYGLALIQAILVAVNICLFVWQGRIRRRIQQRSHGEYHG